MYMVMVVIADRSCLAIHIAVDLRIALDLLIMNMPNVCMVIIMQVVVMTEMGNMEGGLLQHAANTRRGHVRGIQ
jgi:hypothetical protein